MFIFASFGQCWNLLAGFAGQPSLGQNLFFGLGAYTSALLVYYFEFFKANPWPTLFIGGFVSLVLGVSLGTICFRLRGAYFALATLAAAEIARLIILNWDLTLAGLGVMIPVPPKIEFMGFAIDFRSKVPYYYISLIIMLVTFYLTHITTKSRFGFKLLTIREDEDAASTLGVNPFRLKLFAMVISSAICGILGALYAPFISYVDASGDPGGVLSSSMGLDAVIVGILGGMGTVLGPLIGGIIRIGLGEILRITFGWGAGMDQLVFGVIFVLCIISLRGGIWGTVRKFTSGRSLK
jgi:branched-chain amino acid transport system permease protein